MRHFFLILFWFSNNLYAQKHDFSEYNTAIGLSAMNFVPEAVNSISSGRYLSLPFSPTAEFRFNKSNALNLLATINTPYASIRINHRSKWYRTSSIVIGYEHIFFAARRINILTGVGLGYFGLRTTNNISNPKWQSATSFQRNSYIGWGPDLGLRVNVTKRISLETNMNLLGGAWLYDTPFFKNAITNPYFESNAF